MKELSWAQNELHPGKASKTSENIYAIVGYCWTIHDYSS